MNLSAIAYNSLAANAISGLSIYTLRIPGHCGGTVDASSRNFSNLHLFSLVYEQPLRCIHFWLFFYFLSDFGGFLEGVFILSLKLSQHFPLRDMGSFHGFSEILQYNPTDLMRPCFLFTQAKSVIYVS